MIRQGQHQVGVGLIGQVILHLQHLPRGKVDHLRRNVTEQGKVLFVDVVEGPLDFAERDFLGRLDEPDTLSEYDDLLAPAVRAEGNIIVDISYHNQWTFPLG